MRYAIRLCGLDDTPLHLPGGDCPNAANHAPCAEGYVAWHAWAARQAKTHTSKRCPGCNRYRIWEPK